MFSGAMNAPSNHHVSPRSYHVFTIQKPHSNTRFPEPPLKKTQQSDAKGSTKPPRFFLQNYGFFRIAFTAIALGELPAGSIVKRVGNAVPAVRITATSPE